MPNVEYKVAGSAITLEDPDTGTDIQVTEAGLYTRVNNPSKLGNIIIEAIDGTERVVDCTTLSGVNGYPMDLELEARVADCYINQGDASVALNGGFGDARILADRWRRVTVDSPDDAYFAIKQSDATTSGVFVVMRIDSIN